MTAAPLFLWRLAGEPTVAVANDEHVEPCAACGVTWPRTAPMASVVGPNYDPSAGQRPDAMVMCEPCAWAFAGKPPATLRLWSTAARTDRMVAPSHQRCVLDLGPHVHLTNRADMRHIAALLTDPPDGEWLVTVAVSGHKQVVPFAHTNTGSGRWIIRVEDHDVTATPTELAQLLGRAAQLRRYGARASAIVAGNPDVTARRAELAAWQQHRHALAPYRDSPLLALATSFLIKDHVDEYASRYPAPAD